MLSLISRRENVRSPFIFYLYYFVVFFGNAIQGSFLSLYLTNVGVPASTVAVLNGIIQIISLIALAIFGRIADRAPSKNIVLCSGLAVSIVTLILFSQAKSVVAICIFRVAYAAFFTPIASIYETITLDFTSRNGWQYGPIRMTGTLGFSLMALIAGLGLNKNIKYVFPLLIGSYCLTLVLALMLPLSRNTTRKEKVRENGSVFDVLKNRTVRNVMIMFFIYSLGSSLNNTFFGIYTQELGGNYMMVGIANMILGLSELPFHLGPGKRWLNRIGLEKSMLVVLTVGAFRWAVCGLTRSPWVMVMTMGLNGIMLVPVIINLAEFLFANAPEGLKVTTQTTLRSSVSVIAMLIANFGGGALHKALENAGMNPIKSMYLMLVPLFIVALMIGFSSMKKSQKEA